MHLFVGSSQKGQLIITEEINECQALEIMTEIAKQLCDGSVKVREITKTENKAVKAWLAARTAEIPTPTEPPMTSSSAGADAEHPRAAKRSAPSSSTTTLEPDPTAATKIQRLGSDFEMDVEDSMFDCIKWPSAEELC